MRPSFGAPHGNFFLQNLILLRELLEFPLQTLCDRPQRNSFRQFLLAGQNMLSHDLCISRAGPQLEEALEMINRRGMILLVVLVLKPRLEMRQG